MAMALAATVVKRKAIRKTIRIATTDCIQSFSTPNWKKTKVVSRAATSTVRISFIVRSRWVRSAVPPPSSCFLPPSSVTASPRAERMMPAWRTMPISPAMAMPPMPIGRPMYW